MKPRIGVAMLAAGAMTLGLAAPVSGAAAKPSVTIHVATGHKAADGAAYVSYPSGATIRGRVTTPVWAERHVAGSDSLEGLSCASSSFCIATDTTGDVLATKNPAGGVASWVSTHVEDADIHQVSCPSAHLCVAVDDRGDVATSTNPAAAHAVWTVTNVDGSDDIRGISCPNAEFCAAVDVNGDAVVSTDPTGGSGAWSTTNVAASALLSVSCPSTALCIATTTTGDIVTSTNPATGEAKWTSRTVHVNDQLWDVSCPSLTLCVATDINGAGGLAKNGVLVSTNPAGGEKTWRLTPIVGPQQADVFPYSVSCVGKNLCVVGLDDGGVAASVHPTGGSKAWSVRGELLGVVNFVACPSTHQCVAVNSHGYAGSSANPSGLFKVELTERAFPFKARPTVKARQTTTGTGSYSFAVHPTIATRYAVVKVGPGKRGRSQTAAIYVVPTYKSHKPTQCRTTPTCRVTWRFSYRMPKWVQKREANKPWHFYLGVHRGSVARVRTLQRDDAATITQTKVGSDRYQVRVSFAMLVGTGSWRAGFGICRKVAESKDGFYLPGHSRCGQRTLPARYIG